MNHHRHPSAPGGSYMIYVFTVLDKMIEPKCASFKHMLYPSVVMKKSLLDHNEPT